MKKILLVCIILILSTSFISTDEIPYPFIYVPGMFDNGDLLTSDSLLVKNFNNKDGFYFNNYFTDKFRYEKEAFLCSSNIVRKKYNRLIVANLIGPYRTNISLWLMANRLFCLMQGRAPKSKNYKRLIDYEGNDFEAICIRSGKIITFRGLIEEIWAKYGKKVYFQKNKNKNIIVLNPDKKKKEIKDYYINENGYFNTPEEIKLNFVVHSSGGVALRRYIKMCKEENLPTNINIIINLSVPQKGARMLHQLKKAFPLLMEDAISNFWKNKDTKSITIKNKNNEDITFTYQELVKTTSVKMLYGNSKKAKFMRKLIGDYILYQIPFDGVKNVLGRDPALWDLHPNHRLIKTLNNTSIPSHIRIYNFIVLSAYAEMFANLGKYLKLEDNDGVVDYRDTELSHIPNGDKLQITDYIVKKANHIPFPYIKPVFELRETLFEYYGFLGILIKKKVTKDEGVTILYALMKAIMIEFGLDLEYLLKHENFSVIDYFAENPIDFMND